MSPRAACRLESLGFSQVYDYNTGLADWTANGLPTEGKKFGVSREGVVCRDALRVRDALRRDIVTCRLGDTIGSVVERLKNAEQHECVVTSEGGVVLGRLRGDALDGDPSALVEAVMQSGPSTIRPDVSLAEFTKRLNEKQVASVLVTTSTGRLVGILYRTDAEEKLAMAPE